jgi:hypothetical protein
VRPFWGFYHHRSSVAVRRRACLVTSATKPLGIPRHPGRLAAATLSRRIAGRCICVCWCHKGSGFGWLRDRLILADNVLPSRDSQPLLSQHQIYYRWTSNGCSFSRKSLPSADCGRALVQRWEGKCVMSATRALANGASGGLLGKRATKNTLGSVHDHRAEMPASASYPCMLGVGN